MEFLAHNAEDTRTGLIRADFSIAEERCCEQWIIDSS